MSNPGMHPGTHKACPPNFHVIVYFVSTQGSTCRWWTFWSRSPSMSSTVCRSSSTITYTLSTPSLDAMTWYVVFFIALLLFDYTIFAEEQYVKHRLHTSHMYSMFNTLALEGGKHGCTGLFGLKGVLHVTTASCAHLQHRVLSLPAGRAWS